MEKYAILQNFVTVSDGRPTQINIGKVSEDSQKSFLEFVRKCEIKDDGDFCYFELYYNSSIALTIDKSLCLRPKKRVAAPVEWTPEFYPPYDVPPKKDEMVIIIHPALKSSDCIASHKHDCPLCIAAGQCTSPLIRKYIARVFFPEKYCKQK